MLTYHAQRYTIQLQQLMFPGWLSNKASACQAGDAGDMGSIPGSGIPSRRGNGNPLQYSCLGNPKNRGTRWVTVPEWQRVGHDWQLNNNRRLFPWE